MKKIKLPRKRKKAYIKVNGKGNYMMLVILGEILCEENQKHADRFYTYRSAKSKAERKRPDFKNGLVIQKRW